MGQRYSEPSLHVLRFSRRVRSCDSVVHGDDFLILGDQQAIEAMSQLLEGEYKAKMTGCISLVGDADPLAPQELEYLHRVIRALPQTGAMEIEADQRHADVILRELGIDAEVRGKELPSVKMAAAELGQVAAPAALAGETVRKYRSLVMRSAYLSLDRALLECVRHMASQMTEPREGDWCRIQRVGQYLLSQMTEPGEGDWCRIQRVGQYLLRHPCLAAVYKPQSAPKCSRGGAPPQEHLRCMGTTASEGSQLGRARWLCRQMTGDAAASSARRVQP
eukprot:3863151-Amphidinium_carterae.1